MSEGFELSEEHVNRIHELFPESEERRKIAYTLLKYYSKTPSTAEQEKLGHSVERSRNTVYKVLTKLCENGLFSKDTGSVPLYRYTEKIRLSAVGVEPFTPNIQNHPASEVKKVTKKPPPETGGRIPDAPPTSVETPPATNLEARIALQEADMKNLRSMIKGRFDKM